MADLIYEIFDNNLYVGFQLDLMKSDKTLTKD